MAEGRASFWTDLWSFGREILIVLIGVALGLWAQQLAADAGWRETVANAKHDIDRELREAGEEALPIVESRACIPDFGARARRVALGELAGPLPKVSGITLPEPQDAAWQAAISTQALGHLSHKDLEEYAFAYSLLRSLREENGPMREAIAAVRTLDVPRPTRDMAVLQTQLEAIGRLEQYNRGQIVNAVELMDHLRDDLNIRPGAEAVEVAKEKREACTASLGLTPAPAASLAASNSKR